MKGQNSKGSGDLQRKRHSELNQIQHCGNLKKQQCCNPQEKFRVCSACKSNKPLTDFAKDSRRPSGRRFTCKACDNEKRIRRHEKKKKEIERRRRDRHIYRTLSVDEYSIKEINVPFSRKSDSWDQIIRDFIEDAM